MMEILGYTRRFFSEIVRIFAVVTLVIGMTSGGKSRIVFENGVYNNITIAIDPNYETQNCSSLMDAIRRTLTEASNGLSEVLEGRGRFGKIRIIIPSEWKGSECSTGGDVPKDKELYESYASSDIKLTENHPIAVKLPWAEQRMGCGKSGEAIYVPLTFFTGEEFNDTERGRIFLHEWLKFRYGVFEEFGFFGDKYYSPCYRRNAGIHFTSCTDPLVGELDSQSSVSAEGCRSLLAQKNATILTELKGLRQSLMFAPHLVGFGSVPKLCSNSTHNALANTKQNFQCYRKSARDVILVNEDFKGLQSIGLNVSDVPSPDFDLVQPGGDPDRQGYAFVIEVTETSQEKGHMALVKQSVAEFLYFVEEKSSTNMAYMGTFGNMERDYPPRTLSTSRQKEIFLSYFPEVVAERSAGTNSVSDALTNLRTQLESFKLWKWNVLIFASSTPSDLNASLALLKDTDYSVSVITFDNSTSATDWLAWNSEVVTKHVLHVPGCNAASTCIGNSSAIVTQHLVEVLEDQSPRRFLRKVIDIEVSSYQSEQTFTLPELSPETIKNWILTLRTSTSQTEVTLRSPSGRECRMEPSWNSTLLSHLTNTSCISSYEPGTWTLLWSTSYPSCCHRLRGFVETNDGLFLAPSFGVDVSKQVFPSLQNFMVPLHVAVKSSKDEPVVDAQVEVEITYETSTNLVPTVLRLMDDGVDPDVTGGDGVYSGFVHGFSPDPAFHSGFVSVRAESARRVTGLKYGSNEAALFDTRMVSKCCGSYIPAEVTNVGFSAVPFRSLLPSFRTGEVISDPKTSAPSRIELVSMIEETDTHIDLNFIAPKGDVDGSVVDHYDICLATGEGLCKPVPRSNCNPVRPNYEQACLVPKSGLVEEFIDTATRENNTGELITLTCGIRAVNKWNLSSPLSLTVFEVRLIIENDEGTSTPKCESIIRDKCLPALWFWILIGCVILLFLLLLISNIVWCCCFRRKKKSNERLQREDRRNSNFGLGSIGRPSDLKAPDGSFSSRPTYVNRKESEAVRNTSENRTNPEVRRISSRGDINEALELDFEHSENNLPVYFGPGPSAGGSKLKPTVPMKPKHDSHHSNHGLSSYTSYQPTELRSSHTLPSISSAVDARNSRDDRLQTPIYATVNRKGRRLDKIGNVATSMNPVFLNGTVRAHNNTQPNYIIGRPQSSQSIDSGFARSQSRLNSPPPIRMDHFPSSESETYSEMSRDVPTSPPPPPPPPPLPSAADLNGRSPGRPKDNQNAEMAGELPLNETSPPRQAFSPPKENAFSILAKMGPIPDRRMVLRPRGIGPPPPPPPRQNSGRLQESSFGGNNPNTSQTRLDGLRPDNSSDVETNDNASDDDSDNWDVYDDFEFNPGTFQAYADRSYY